jgi:DNA-binding transcriptional MerR regulator
MKPSSTATIDRYVRAGAMPDLRNDKAPDAFRTISEVADDLDLPQHVLRFWEGRFSQIKPLKRGGGRRYYRPDDIDLLRGIKHLLYGEGYTIKGVQRILKAQGLKFVQTVWREPGSLPPDLGNDQTEDDFDDDIADIEPVIEAERDEPPPARPKLAAAPLFVHARAAVAPTPVAPVVAPPSLPLVHAPEPVAALSDIEPTQPRSAVEPGFTLRRANSEVQPEPVLARDDIRRLQSALFELIEAKKLLDAMR